jgi:hypothetical protein
MIGLDTIKLGKDFDYTYLSLGAGVQSSALLVLSCTDDRIPKPDVAIFADTGDEPQYVYDYLDILTDFGSQHGVKIVKATRGVLSEETRQSKLLGTRSASIPLFTKNADGSEGMLRRQCTSDYKIDPIQKKVRELLGYKPRQRIKENVRAMLGISMDEMTRMKESNLTWIMNCFPLIDLELRREHCIEIMKEAGLPEPLKSACVYCPYHSDDHWQWLKDEHPLEFGKAVEFDNLIRDLSAKNVQQTAFVHRSCVPLAQVEFNTGDPDQVDMFNNECEGMCGV